jgi:hypothetical protein
MVRATSSYVSSVAERVRTCTDFALYERSISRNVLD